VRRNKNHHITQVKNNQKGLLDTMKNVAKYSKHIDEYTTKERERNRIEIRTTKIYAPSVPIYHLGYIYDNDWRSLIKTIIKTERERKTKTYKKKQTIWKKTKETSYFISTTGIHSAKQLNKIIRNHWGIENKNHHIRDTALEEDKSRIRKNPGVFARLRSFALNILRHKKVKNVRRAIYENTLDCEGIVRFVLNIG